MLLVTGGAGFIGSNIVASLNEAGRTDIVVNDTLGTDEPLAQSAEAAARRCRAAGRPVALARRAQARRRHPHGRDLRHHRRRRRPGHAIPISACRSTLLDWCTADRDALHLCVVGRDLWRRRSGLRRRCVAGTSAFVAADESLWLEQASVRPGPGRAQGSAARNCRRNGPA